MRAGRAAPWIIVMGLLAPCFARAAPPSAAYVRRLEQQALLMAFDADLLGHDSATAVLQSWCDAHAGAGAKITAERVRGVDKPLATAAQAALKIAAGQPTAYRRVRLVCGRLVLSEADNWYRPDRLTASMNQALDGTDSPFGVVVGPLGFRRTNLTSQVLYHPLPEGWERQGADTVVARAEPDASIPDAVIRNTAVLTDRGGEPFSYVVETYSGDVLKMALPATVGR